MLKTRGHTAPAHTFDGYSIKISDGTRFPSIGFNHDTRNPFQDSFEFLDDVSEDPADQVATFDFGLKTKRKSNFKTFNKVSHYKMSILRSGSQVQYSTDYVNYGIPLAHRMWDTAFITSAAPASTLGRSEIPFEGLPLLYAGPFNGVYNSDQGLASFAVQRMLPGIVPSASLLNSIYELKDLKTLPRTILKLESSLVNFKALYKPSSWKKLVLKKIVDGAADSYLQSKFNVSPMLQDVSNVIASVKNLRKQLKQLQDNMNTPVRRHFGADLSGFDDGSQTAILNVVGGVTSPPGFITCQRFYRYPVKRFQATIEYKYVLTDPPEDLFRHGIADLLGLTPSPQVIWAAIPWSFVVDWVVGIGPWLRQFTGRQLGVVTHISKFGWSVKVQRDVELLMGPYGRVATSTETSYYRTPSSAPLVSSIQSSGLNPTEFSLGAALAITHVKP
jgi:hypothetical protein